MVVACLIWDTLTEKPSPPAIPRGIASFSGDNENVDGLIYTTVALIFLELEHNKHQLP
jgi:hypothetical protein